ncbi:hypothetical protein L218DRAFT_982684 [Marasmius fiardii PR-910]|nr:hypothetical protein L218DRAFT_982684 [Marasmius fiardii PR-910]
MNRPRFSILEQFDPLLSKEQEPTTPTILDSDHEDELSDPEKENTAPESSSSDITLCTFFTKGPKQPYSTPVKLTKRLIDVGDMTVASAGDGEDGDLEGENQGTADDNDEELSLPMTPRTWTLKRTPNSPRTPLAEISIRGVPAAPLHRATSRAHHDSSPQLSEEVLKSLPPPNSSLSLVINTVNSTGTAFGKIQPTTSTIALSASVGNGHPIPPPHAPKIQVYSPEEDLTKSESLLNKVPAPFDMAELNRNDADTSNDTSLLTPPIPRTNHVNTSSDDPIRQSLDLHASFQLHLQSPESSFDLLNDKISFLDGNSRMLPSFALEDDSDEYEGRIQDSDISEGNASVTPTNSLTPEKLSTPSEITFPEAEPNSPSDSPVSPTTMLPSMTKAEPPSETMSPEKSETPSSARPEESEAATLLPPIVAERGAVLSTPGYRNSVPYVPPVPALRIIKRTKRYDTKVSKPLETTATYPPLCVSLAQQTPEAPGQRSYKAEPFSRTASPTIVPLRCDSTSSNEGKNPDASIVRPVRTSQPVQPAKPGAPMPMRIAPAMFSTSRPQSILAQRGLSYQTSAAGSNGSGNVVGPRRVIVSEVKHEKPVHKSTSSLMTAKRSEHGVGRTLKTELALPSRTTYNTGGVSAPASGMPRPVGAGSKLPAPTSGIARLKGAGSAAPRGPPAPRRA